MAQGIRLIATQVTINGSLTWSGASCAKNGLVVRADNIDGAGTVSSTERALLLYGTGGVAPGLMATGATRSLMPPARVTSSNYPEGNLYNDDGPPALFTWEKPFSAVVGYYYVIGGGSSVPTPTSNHITTEALAMADPPRVGATVLSIVTIDSNGVIGTVPHEMSVNIVSEPPELSSPTNPIQGTYSTNSAVVMAWDGGNPGLGYLRVFDQFPSTRPTPQTGAFEPTNRSPPQVLFQNVAPGRWFFHMLARDSMGYSTRLAAHYEVDIGMEPDAGTVAGTVKDSSGVGIVGATVIVQRGLYTTSTVAGGVYTFNNSLPAGSYELTAKKTGFKAQAMNVVVTPAQTSEVNFVLEAGTGCPTCADPCSATACGRGWTGGSSCSGGGSNRWGTCQVGVCVGPVGSGVLVSAGDSHTCAVTSAGGVKCWGYNGYGQLGNGTTTTSLVPADVSGLSSGVTAISAGNGHSCAVTSAGGVRCWGYNGYGQVGNGTTSDSLVPVDVTGLSSGVIAISVGDNHTCAVTSARGVKCWGNNGYGQLGNRSASNSSTPVDVTGLNAGVTAISAGAHHTCAVTSAGGGLCWGYNGWGGLGNGSTSDSLVPVDVTGLTSGITAISTGAYYACAVTSAGGVKCWGYNFDGQLGNGTTSISLVPVYVTGLSSRVATIAGGGAHVCSITTAGGVKCWGYNISGQLGNGSTSNSSTPVDVSGLTCGASVIAMGAGARHSCAVLSGGGIKCWGGNDSGQLGNGSTSYSSTPVDVVGL